MTILSINSTFCSDFKIKMSEQLLKNIKNKKFFLGHNGPLVIYWNVLSRPYVPFEHFYRDFTYLGIEIGFLAGF